MITLQRKHELESYARSKRRTMHGDSHSSGVLQSVAESVLLFRPKTPALNQRRHSRAAQKRSTIVEVFLDLGPTVVWHFGDCHPHTEMQLSGRPALRYRDRLGAGWR